MGKLAQVVMLTAAAGPGLDLQYGDIFETDEVSAKRLIDGLSAREVGPQDKDAPVKREAVPVVTEVASGEQRVASESRSQVDDANDADDESIDDDGDSDDPPAVDPPAPKPTVPRRTTSRRR